MVCRARALGVFDTLRADFGVTAECFRLPSTRASFDLLRLGGRRRPIRLTRLFFEFRPARAPTTRRSTRRSSAPWRVTWRCCCRPDKLGAVLLCDRHTDVAGRPVLEGPWLEALHVVDPTPKVNAYIDGGQHQGRRAVPLRSNHDSTVFCCRVQVGRPRLFLSKERRREKPSPGLKINGAHINKQSVITSQARYTAGTILFCRIREPMAKTKE